MRTLLFALALLICRSQPQTTVEPTMEALAPIRWIDHAVPLVGPGRPKATLVRFWTDGCPHCRLSLPAIAALRREFHDEGLETIAVYHARGPHPLSPSAIEAAARELGYEGPLAQDPEWKALSALGLGERTGRMTSASFLFDHEGKVRFAHPGPELHPSTEAEHRTCDQAFARLRAGVRDLLR
jgi:thiol-disulfide isomerase/thioredoxin